MQSGEMLRKHLAQPQRLSDIPILTQVDSSDRTKTQVSWFRISIFFPWAHGRGNVWVYHQLKEALSQFVELVEEL